MSTPFIPLKSIQSWYDDDPGVVPITLFLVGASVTTMLDSYDTVSDLPGLLATTGNYNATTGIDAGDWPLYYDSTSGVLELSLPDRTWLSAVTYSLTFRWIAVSTLGGFLLNLHDFGSAQTINNSKMSLYATESTVIPNSFPVMRWTKA